MSRIRLGAIAFINTLPIYLNLPESDDLDIVYNSPAKLNASMDAGELEISPVSSAYYLRNRDKLVLLNELSVSSKNSVESVLFLSKKPLTEALLDQPVVPVPDDSETSVALLAELIQRRSGQDLRPWFLTYPADRYRDILQKLDSALIIGDNALLIHENGIPEGFHCYDLASLWAEETGLPFVFAVWVAKRTWAIENPEKLSQVNEALKISKTQFFNDTKLLEQGVEFAHSRCKISKERISRYFTQSLDYNLDESHRLALTTFGRIINNLDKLPLEQQPFTEIDRSPAGASS